MDLLESIGAFLEGAAKDKIFVWLVSVLQLAAISLGLSDHVLGHVL